MTYRKLAHLGREIATHWGKEIRISDEQPINEQLDAPLRLQCLLAAVVTELRLLRRQDTDIEEQAAPSLGPLTSLLELLQKDISSMEESIDKLAEVSDRSRNVGARQVSSVRDVQEEIRGMREEQRQLLEQLSEQLASLTQQESPTAFQQEAVAHLRHNTYAIWEHVKLAGEQATLIAARLDEGLSMLAARLPQPQAAAAVTEPEPLTASSHYMAAAMLRGWRPAADELRQLREMLLSGDDVLIPDDAWLQRLGFGVATRQRLASFERLSELTWRNLWRKQKREMAEVEALLDAADRLRQVLGLPKRYRLPAPSILHLISLPNTRCETCLYRGCFTYFDEVTEESLLAIHYCGVTTAAEILGWAEAHLALLQRKDAKAAASLTEEEQA